MNKDRRNLADFSGMPIYVGLDVHKKSWKVTVRTQHTEHHTFSMDPDPGNLVNYLERHFPGGAYSCVYEAGFSGFWIQRQLTESRVNCIVVNPSDIPTSDKERDRKSDRADSRKLARELKDGSLRAIATPTPEQEADRSLVRRREDLIRRQTRIKNQIKAFLVRYNCHYPGGESGHWSRAYVQWVSELDLVQESANQTLKYMLQDLHRASDDIKAHTRQLRHLSRQPRHAQSIRLLMTIPSVGLITALTLQTELWDIHRFNGLDALCSFVGLVPSTHGSGEKAGVGRLSRRGNRHLMSLLVECAWVARRSDPALMLCYESWVRRMPGQKAIIKVARKLLARIRHVLLRQEEYVLGLA